MNPIPHPAVFLPAGVAASLRTSAAAAEEQRDLTPAQLDTIYGEQWFRFFVPAMYGGQPLSLPDAVRLEEAISWADGSAGWTVTLCAGAGWFTGFFPLSATGSSPSALTSFFSDRQLCLAGSGAPSGRADQLPEGYRVSGRWQYASGALHATGFTANCVIHSEGRPVLNEDGTPQIRAFLFKKEEVFVHRDWDTIGLIATASHAFEVRDRIVPADRCFRIAPENAAIDEPLYGYPFLQLAEVTLAACLSGMAMHFVDCCERLFAERQRVGKEAVEKMDEALEMVKSELGLRRMEFYTALDGSWNEHVETADVHKQRGESVSTAAHALTACARWSVDLLYPYGGLTAAKPGTEINRVWRDIHTASQHNLLAFGA